MCEPRKNENFSPGKCSKELELPGIVALQRLRLEDCHEFEFSYSAVLPVINTTKQAEAGGTYPLEAHPQPQHLSVRL